MIKSKRAQSLPSSTGEWILALAVLVLLLLGAVLIYNTFLKPTKVIPQDLQLKTAACIGFAKAGDLVSVSYCKEFQEYKLTVGTKTINCEYSDIESAVAKEAKPLVCDADEGINYCLKLKQNVEGFTKEISIYNKGTGFFDCKPLLASGGVSCQSLVSSWTSACDVAKGQDDNTLKITDKTDFLANIGQKCCGNIS
jgi:hypothetical protein